LILPRLTFGIIVLNGEPFTRYTLRSLYPHAHQIVVVEGAAYAASNVATADGHSSDGTLEVLRRFKAEEDPEDKVTVVTAEDEGHPDGFWPGEKDEQSAAYARRATGDYLWQVDIDEFYRSEDMRSVISILEADPTITAMSFRQVTFWGGLDYWVDGWYLRRGATYYHRLFKWRPDYSYVTHRPPTVRDDRGRDLREVNWYRPHELERSGVHLYHYSLLLPKQVLEKCDYYATASWAQRTGARDWAEGTFLRLERPYRVHNVYQYPSWLERYRGEHPEQIRRMEEDIRAGRLDVEMRATDDIERLLSSLRYRAGRAALKALEPVDRSSPAIVALAKSSRGLARRAFSR
jgi:hypothetical protein